MRVMMMMMGIVMLMMMMMTMIKVIKTYHENDQPAAGSDSAKPCTFGEIWLANSGDWVFLGVRGFRCKLRSWTLLLVLHGGYRIGLSSNAELQKRADRADQSVLFFLAGANFWEKHAKNCAIMSMAHITYAIAH